MDFSPAFFTNSPDSQGLAIKPKIMYNIACSNILTKFLKTLKKFQKSCKRFCKSFLKIWNFALNLSENFWIFLRVREAPLCYPIINLSMVDFDPLEKSCQSSLVYLFLFVKNFVRFFNVECNSLIFKIFKICLTNRNDSQK